MAYVRAILSSVLGLVVLQIARPVDGQRCDTFANTECEIEEQCQVNSSTADGFCSWAGPGLGVQCIQPSLKFGPECGSNLNCRCFLGMCLQSDMKENCEVELGTDCAVGDFICGDPHMVGLAGQKVDWWGEDGAWYSLLKDKDSDLNINVRLTAPLPDDFPERQLITGVSIMSHGKSIMVENTDPYSAKPAGCAEDVTLPCLSNGGITVTVNGHNAPELLSPVQGVVLGGDLVVSSANLPVECRQFGGHQIWARMYEEMMEGRRRLKSESFEEWVLRFDEVAAPEWCAKYINERGLSQVQSLHSIFQIETGSLTVRLNAGVNQQGDGEVDKNGREVPDLEFWQMDVGFEGLDASRYMTGVLGETARPVVNIWGDVVMEGMDAIRGAVSDYKVSGPYSDEFAMDVYSK